MVHSNEAALLRTLAQNHQDNATRLVYADWLEEQGLSARAEFVRVHAELATLPPDDRRRNPLRLRERQLLKEHYAAWCAAYGLNIANVAFANGVIDKMRLTDWQNGMFLQLSHQPWFATLSELELSRLKLDDAALARFAETADFPALRKLMLHGNKITLTGMSALANAKGLPALQTLYLFDNPGSATDQDRERARTLFYNTSFSAVHVDLGEHDEGYCMSAGQADVARIDYLRRYLIPASRRYFDKYPLLQSAMLCVAQYWADEADDAVHGYLVLSELLEPTLNNVFFDGESEHRDPNIPNSEIISQYSETPCSAVSLWEARAMWDDNSGAIPLWSAYAAEEGSQEYDRLEGTYSPAVYFYRYGAYEFLPMPRPHLSGIRPQWGFED